MITFGSNHPDSLFHVIHREYEYPKEFIEWLKYMFSYNNRINGINEEVIRELIGRMAHKRRFDQRGCNLETFDEDTYVTNIKQIIDELYQEFLAYQKKDKWRKRKESIYAFFWSIMVLCSSNA